MSITVTSLLAGASRAPGATIRTLPQVLKSARFDIDETFGADDRVVVRWTPHSTSTGPFAGLSPTQKKTEVRGISLYRLREGKITEIRNLADLLALFTQLGTIQQKQNMAAG
jgi:predicted ester cyclase